MTGGPAESSADRNVCSTTNGCALGVRCVVCHGSGRPLFSVGGYAIRECESCGHQFADVAASPTHVEETYGDDYFHGGGAGYTDYLSESQLLIARGRSYARRVGRYCPPGKVLDVGAAAGFTLRGFADVGWDVQGIEPNPRMADYARETIRVPVEAASLETWRGGGRFDLVTMLQVLPHFVDPRAAVAAAARCLRPGGYLLIETWDRKSLTARVYGQSWHEYSPPSVLHWFSRATLTRLMASEGLALVAAGRPTRWISVGHAKSVLRHKADASLVHRLMLAAARLLPDALAVPYPYDDLVWMLFKRADAESSAAVMAAVEPAGP